MATYSFQDVTASLMGTGGVINLGAGSANSKEGITITLNQPRNAMTGGADGEYMHSLRADKTGTITIRLLNTSPVNSQLQTLYAAQSLSSSAWGNNLIVVQNRGNNEVTTARGCAFQRQPDHTYAEDGGFVEWVFDCGKIDTVTGTYSTGE